MAAPVSVLSALLKPTDVGSLGAYSVSTVSGTVAAGSATIDIWAFRNGASNYCIVRKVTIAAWDVTTAFAAGRATFNLFVGRSFTASYTTNGVAATLTGDNAKKKTAFATTGIAQIYTLNTAAAGITGATRTLDSQAVAAYTAAVTATVNAVIFNTQTLLDYTGFTAAWPLVLGPNEGLVLQSTVPATGTWVFQVTIEWEEVAVSP